MRDHSNHVQVSYEQAVTAILGACDFAPGVEEAPLDLLVGRVLAQDAVAQMDVPNALTCRMDSIAVKWADFESGLPDVGAWERGVDWEFANTGVAMPNGFDTAIVVENVRFDADDRPVEILAVPTSRFAGTSAIGSRMRAGDVLVAAGAEITPLLAAHMAGGGVTSAAVVAKPKVAFIPTGSELVKPASSIPIGTNIDSNSVLMRGKIEQWGGQALLFPICPDDPEAIEASLRAAADQADIVVLNAGSSKGSDDYSLEVLERIGTVLYHQTNHGPGHHCSCSVLDGVPVIGISGPPGGAAFTADFYLKPAMDVFLGRAPEPERMRVRLGEPFASGGPKRSAQPSGGSGPVGGSATCKRGGENRPAEKGPFFSVRQLALRQADDGVWEAFPAASAHPGPVEAERMDAYYLLATGEGDVVPGPGDMIEVFLRPGRRAALR